MNGPEDRDTIRALRAGLEELRTDPMGEEEMMDLIREAEPEGRPKRIALVAGVVAAVVLALAGGALLLCGGGKAELFAEGPQVAGAEEVEVRPPPLRVPRTESWDSERYRALLTVQGEEATIRLSYEPEDGGPRVRPSSALMPVAPRPKGAPERTLVAVLLNADAETPWQRIRTALDGPMGVLYLAGEEPGGTLGALGAIVPTGFGDRQALQETQRLGAAVTPKDLAAAFPPEQVFQLRITRRAGRTRYRFGLHPIVGPGVDRLGLGDVTRTAAELSGGGEIALPGLRAAVPTARAGTKRGLVFLETGSGVRYVDVLRALESANGCWLLTTAAGTRPMISGIELPEPLDPADGAALTEDPGGGLWTVVNVNSSGEFQLRGRRRDPATFDFNEPGTEVWLRADRRAAFSPCRLVLEQAVAAGCPVRIVLCPEEPGIQAERLALLPLVPDAEGGQRVELRLGVDGSLAWTEPQLDKSRSVVLALPDDAVAGQVVPVLLRLVRLGCTSIRFE